MEPRERYMRWRWARIAHRAFTRAREQRLPDMGATLAYFTILSLLAARDRARRPARDASAPSRATTQRACSTSSTASAPTRPTTTRARSRRSSTRTPTPGWRSVSARCSRSTRRRATSAPSSARRTGSSGSRRSRPFWKLRPLQMPVTLSTVAMLGVSLIVLVVSGPIADAIGRELGIPARHARRSTSSRSGRRTCSCSIAVVGLLVRARSPNVAPECGAASSAPARLWSGRHLAAIGSAGFSVYVSRSFTATTRHYGEPRGRRSSFILWIWLSEPGAARRPPDRTTSSASGNAPGPGVASARAVPGLCPGGPTGTGGRS